LASFVAGLSGEVGRQVKFQNHQDLRQALTTALAVREALKQERFAENLHQVRQIGSAFNPAGRQGTCRKS